MMIDDDDDDDPVSEVGPVWNEVRTRLEIEHCAEVNVVREQ